MLKKTITYTDYNGVDRTDYKDLQGASVQGLRQEESGWQKVHEKRGDLQRFRRDPGVLSVLYGAGD